ncbi:MAG: DUF4249 domain-containing protein [Cyclobacteriaceae bacterium]|nr:DUF4249 domain-containing protein [Cyclobacteriaceae bacterium]
MRKTNKRILLFIAPLWLLTSCVKPFDYESVSYEKLIVVDGSVTDVEKPHRVKLQYTYPINQNSIMPIQNATVWVQDGKGNRYPFMESEKGEYLSAPFAGISGESYQLHFTTTDGKVYESSAVTLKKSPPIDSIYNRYAELPSDELHRNEGGLQFFIDTHDDKGEARHFRYEWEDTYLIRVPYPSNFHYYPENNTWEMREEQVGTCYTSSQSTRIILGNMQGKSQNRLAEVPIHFVSQENPTLRNRYTILIRQYSLDENTYNYYKKIKESIESGGSLFDKQQGSIPGNIERTDNPREPVLGYFEVAGITEMRTFFDYTRDLKDKLKKPVFPYYCRDQLILTTNDSVAYYYNQNRTLVVVNDLGMPFEPSMELAPRECADCSYYASTKKPDFWVD